MKNAIRKKRFNIVLIELIFLCSMIFLFISKHISRILEYINIIPEKPDIWAFCFRIGYQIQRVLGIHDGGIWDMGYYYPLDGISALFEEPLWGISLMITPVWLVIKNLFLIYYIAGIAALALTWIFIYYFARNLGVHKLPAFYCGAMFTLSHMSVSLIAYDTAGWPFFMIPLLGLTGIMMINRNDMKMAVFWGVVFAYLAWSSLHVFVTGGVFLYLIFIWKLYPVFSFKNTRVILTASAITLLFILNLYVSMTSVHHEFGFERAFMEPAQFAINLPGLIYRDSYQVPYNILAHTGLWSFLKSLNKNSGANVGMPVLLLISSVLIFFFRLYQSSSNSVNVDLKDTVKKKMLLLSSVLTGSSLVAWLNIQALNLQIPEFARDNIHISITGTMIFHLITGLLIYLIWPRFRAAINKMDFAFIFAGLVLGSLAFGPYYPFLNETVIVSPVAFIQYWMPVISSIRTTLRWSLPMVLSLSLGTAIFLSESMKKVKNRPWPYLLIILSLIEVFPGLGSIDLRDVKPFEWKPAQIDEFLKEYDSEKVPVIEMQINHCRNTSTYLFITKRIYASLYHKKTSVLGYASFEPREYTGLFGRNSEETLNSEDIKDLKALGPKLWVFHIDKMEEDDWNDFFKAVNNLVKIQELNDGNILVYEDPEWKEIENDKLSG